MATNLLNKSPASLGYRMPAEWEKHEAIWLSWPYDPDAFPNRLEKVQNTTLQIIKYISSSEKVYLIVRNEADEKNVKDQLSDERIDLDKIKFHFFSYVDIWIRDYGPIFIVNPKKKELAITHWIFNAWGEKYKELMEDTRIPTFINRNLQIPSFNPGIILEGGSIEINGKGTLITTEQCLLNKNRNPHLSKKRIESYLKEYLGVSKIIWLKDGIAGDDTDGHVDDIARFVGPTTILCAYEDNEKDENYGPLKNNYEILKKAVDNNGEKFNVVKLPMPGFVGECSNRLPASYANFYIGNNVVLVPVFSHENDQKALRIIQRFFPDRKVIGIDCVDLLYGLGTIHCISQQQPSLSA